MIFWPRSQRRVHCHTAKLEPNWWVTIDWVPLLVLDYFLGRLSPQNSLFMMHLYLEIYIGDVCHEY
jgi:hypothetical protein